MKTRAALIAFALTALIALVPTAAGAATASGRITVEGLTLAGTQFGTPSGQPTTVPTDPLAVAVTGGDHFLYSTITCASAFPPWNSRGLHFDPDYPGITDPASVRHEFEGTVTHTARGGAWSVVQGAITTSLCENGVRTDQIVSSFSAAIFPSSSTSVPLVGGGPVPTTGGHAIQGSARIVSGTGRFQDMRGGGTLVGQFTCLPGGLVRNGVSSCADLGAYSETAFQLRGSFVDPTA